MEKNKLYRIIGLILLLVGVILFSTPYLFHRFYYYNLPMFIYPVLLFSAGLIIFGACLYTYSVDLRDKQRLLEENEMYYQKMQNLSKR